MRRPMWVGRCLAGTVLLLISLLAAPWPVFAAESGNAEVIEEVSVVVDGKEAQLDDPVKLMDGRLFVPVAQLGRLFGASVEWNPEVEEITIHTADDDEIVLGNGVPVVSFNDKRYMMDTAPFLTEGRTYIPLRHVAALMDAKVNWDADEMLVELVRVEEVDLDSMFSEAEEYTEEEFMLLAKLVQVEAGHESYEGQLAVANVILNRVKHSKFPNSIHDVIYSGKQFPPAHNGLLDKSQPNDSVLKAVKDALNGKNNVEDAVYFFNPKVSKGSFWNRLEVIETIGNHRFAK
jgi:N-acetylmuramoyl-L-alanine amidase